MGSYSADGQFALLFTDVGNNGDLTLAVCQVTASSGISRSTPNLLITEYSALTLTSGLPTTELSLNQVYQWGAFAVGRNQSSNGQMLLASVTADQATSQPRPVIFSVLETKAKPIGVLQSNNQVILSGTVTIAGTTTTTSTNSLKVGAVYYALTNGSLLQSSTPLGQYPLAPGYDTESVYVSPRLLEYVEEGNIAVTMDSRVGVAISSNSLLLLPMV